MKRLLIVLLACILLSCTGCPQPEYRKSSYTSKNSISVYVLGNSDSITFECDNSFTGNTSGVVYAYNVHTDCKGWPYIKKGSNVVISGRTVIVKNKE